MTENVLQIMIEAVNKTQAAFKSMQGDINAVKASATTMGTTADKASATIKGGMDKAAVATKEAGAAAKTSSGGFTSMLKSLGPLILMFGAYKGVVDILKSGSEETNNNAQAQANLAQTVKSTGGAAGLTAKQLGDMSDKLADNSVFEEAAVKNGVAMLATFTNIGATKFDGASQALVDLAQKMGSEPQLAAIQLGKALNDPIKGITALKRVGVTFSEDQKKVVKSLVETGQTAAAQQLIIDELNKEFGGQAAAATTTYAGKIKILRKEMDDFTGQAIAGAQRGMQHLGGAFADIIPNVEGLGEKIGDKLERAISSVGDTIKNVTTFFRENKAVLTAVKVVVEGIALAFVSYKAVMIAVAIQTKLAAAGQWLLNIAMDANPIGAIVLAVMALVAALVVLVKWYNASSVAAKKAFEDTVAANAKAEQAQEESINKLAKAATDKIYKEIEDRKGAWAVKEKILTDEYDAEIKNGAKILKSRQDNLAAATKALEDGHTAAIKAINDEYGVFEAKQLSKTQVLQDTQKAYDTSVKDMLSQAQTVATSEGEAFAESQSKILADAQATHDAKISMYVDEYLASIGVVNDDLRNKVNAYKSQIDALNNQTEAEEAAIKKSENAQKISDLQIAISKAETAESIATANKNLQDEIARQNREGLLQQRNDEKKSLETAITTAQDEAIGKKKAALTTLTQRVADEQKIVGDNTTFQIGEIQKVRIAKEEAENKKYNAAKLSLDNEKIALDTFLEEYNDKKYNQYYGPKGSITLGQKQRDDDVKTNENSIKLLNQLTAAKIKAAKQTQNLNDITAAISLHQSLIDKLTSSPLYGLGLNYTKIQAQNQFIIDLEQKLRDMEVPGYASGGITKGGYARTDENGGEVKSYPSGTLIIPNDISRAMARSAGSYNGGGGNYYNITVHASGNVTKNERELGDAIGTQILKQVKMLGKY